MQSAHFSAPDGLCGRRHLPATFGVKDGGHGSGDAVVREVGAERKAQDTLMIQADQYERYMLELINAARANVGAAPLRLELSLNQSAEDHSEWMLQTNYFSHTGAGGSSATQRMRDAGFDFSGWWQSAENIAVRSEGGDPGIWDEVYLLHQQLMNSSGHRANLLDPELQYIGIGIELGSFNFGGGSTTSVIVTQNFGKTSGSVNLDNGQGSQTSDPDPDPDPAPVPPPSPDPLPPTAGSGADRLTGTGASETLNGLGGNDSISGNSGNDTLIGGSGDDELKGNSGFDRLQGDAGSDRLLGGSGNDVLLGGSGNDRLVGQSGHDRMFGEDGNDTLSGGSGYDIIDGGRGNDKLFGRDDADTFVFDPGHDVDRIRDFENNIDQIDLREFDFASVSQALSFASQQGAHTVFDFGGGDRLIVDNITVNALADDLLI